jgi:protein-S-isoprenylcysteine O-methyltransferase Ste14
MRKSTRDAVATALFLIVAPGAVVGLVPWLITGWREAPALLGFAPLRWLGMVLVGLCVLILLDSFWRFAREGLGSPAPVYPTERLVTTGLYRHVRNPMYVALVAGILGQALWLPSGALIIYAALVALAAHLFVRFYEEPALKRAHGAQYAAYCAAVPRWLPRLAPWRGDEPQG